MPVPASSPAELLLLKWLPPEVAASPEMRYLLDLDRVQARRAFGRVRSVVASSPDGLPPALLEESTEPWLLVLGGSDLLLLERSLERMRNEIEATERREGTGERPLGVAPVLLETTDLPARHDLFTLHDFEQAEARFLDRDGAAEAAHADATAEVLLLRREDAIEALAAAPGSSPFDLLDPASAAGRTLSRRAAGLCHRFVDYYGVVRQDVLPFVPEDLGSVLEIGCARGGTAALLKERFGCRAVGVELNPDVAAEAKRRLDRVLIGDVAELDPDERFDLVLGLELFEHLTDNAGFLHRAGRWLAPGGRIVLSVPNVGHYSIVEDLIAGRWDYLPIGLLCSTHYRFFTRRTLEDWIEAAGFERYELHPQRTELPERVRAWAGATGGDLDSLATSGFWVVIHAPATAEEKDQR